MADGRSPPRGSWAPLLGGWPPGPPTRGGVRHAPRCDARSGPWGAACPRVPRARSASCAALGTPRRAWTGANS
eukprot:9175496-Alexandrium_andersonii.AAC.1